MGWVDRKQPVGDMRLRYGMCHARNYGVGPGAFEGRNHTLKSS
jgi:hypothetical protein